MITWTYQEKIREREIIRTSTHLLSQNELCILIVGILASFELSDLDVLLLEFLVVALFFLDQTVEHRGGDCKLGRGGHCGSAVIVAVAWLGI